MFEGVCVFCNVGGGSVLSLAGWKVGACLVPVMISDSKRGSEREREASGCSFNKRLEKTIC